MYCKDCKFKIDGNCTSAFVFEAGGISDNNSEEHDNKSLIYPYNEDGYFAVGDYFGCINFESKE